MNININDNSIDLYVDEQNYINQKKKTIALDGTQIFPSKNKTIDRKLSEPDKKMMEKLHNEDLNDSDINHEGTGLSNCGNSCFFNSVNQMLFHIPEFREFLIKNKDIFKNEIILNLIELFKLMKTKGNKSNVDGGEMLHDRSLSNYYSLVQQKFYIELGDGGNTGSQRDASELLTKYFERIFEELYSYILIPDSGELTKSLLNELKINIPIFEFFFLQKEDIKCLDDPTIIKTSTFNCNFVYNQASYIDPNDKTKIKFKINLNDEEEIRTANNNYIKCIKKDLNGNEIKQINTGSTLEKDPNEYIIIPLKRFFQEPDGTTIKLNDPIDNFNIKNNNDEFIISDRYNNKYKLLGGINHGGGVSGGHYFYSHKVRNIWNSYNDSSVYPNLPSSSGLYVLLFKRQRDVQLYQNVTINVEQLNQTILNNLNKYLKDDDLYKFYRNFDNFEKSDALIKFLLTYYSNLINLKSNPNYRSIYDPIIVSIINKIKDKIKKLLQ
jgi:ubiquitin C-terminal hydrolase